MPAAGILLPGDLPAEGGQAIHRAVRDLALPEFIAPHPCRDAGVRAQLTDQRAHLARVDVAVDVLRLHRVGHGEIVQDQDPHPVAQVVEDIQFPGVSTPEPDDVHVRPARQPERPLVALRGTGEVERLVERRPVPSLGKDRHPVDDQGQLHVGAGIAPPFHLAQADRPAGPGSGGSPRGEPVEGLLPGPVRPPKTGRLERKGQVEPARGPGQDACLQAGGPLGIMEQDLHPLPADLPVEPSADSQVGPPIMDCERFGPDIVHGPGRTGFHTHRLPDPRRDEAREIIPPQHLGGFQIPDARVVVRLPRTSREQ